MVKRHLSRLTSPTSWTIRRKGIKFITRPNPGAHSQKGSIPLSLVMTSLLKVARTKKEVKKILHDGEVLVNNKVRRDYAYPLGLMDVIQLPSLKQAFRVTYTEKGKFALLPLKDKEQNLLLGKVSDKTVLKKGKVQLHKENGTNVLVDKDTYKTGDTIIQSLKDGKIVEHLSFEKGAKVYLTGGNNVGKVGSLEEVKGHNIVVKTAEGSLETAKRYAFVVGEHMVLAE